MDWTTAIGSGGAWMLAMGIGYAVLSGKLRLEREVTERDTRIKDLTTKLDSVSSKAVEVVEADASATRQELTELRKTNAQLVELLSGRAS